MRVRHCQQPIQDRGRGGGRASRVPLECLHPLPEGGWLVQVWRGPAGPGGKVTEAVRFHNIRWCMYDIMR